MTRMAGARPAAGPACRDGTALVPHRAGPVAQMWPHSGIAIDAAHQACPRASIAAGGPTRSLPGRRAPEASHRVKPLVSAAFTGVSEGIRTPDTQDHNYVGPGAKEVDTPVFLGFLVTR